MSKLVLSAGEQNNSDTTPFNARGGKTGEAMLSQLHGRYYEQCYRGNVFSVANQAAVTTTASLQTTFTGLSVANPAGSAKNLVMLRFACAQFAVGAAAVVGVAAGAGAAAGSLTIRNRKYGGVSSVAVGSASATIAAPILLAVAGSVGSVATTGYALQAGVHIDFDGSLIIPPGYFVCSDTSIATTSALIFEFVWEEVAI
jgi:hypothetical protein